MNRIKNLVAITAFSLLVLCLPAIASAQYGNGGYNNGGYNNGGYNNGYSGDIRSTVRDLKDSSKNFKNEVDRQTGGVFGGINRSNDRYLRDLANQFKKASERLEDHYRNGRDQYKLSLIHI